MDAIIVSVTATAKPSASMAGFSAESTSSMTRMSRKSAYSRAMVTALDSRPWSRSMRSAGPLRARPPTMGRTAGARGGGSGEDGPDADQRIGRGEDDRPRLVYRLDDAGSGPGGIGAFEDDLAGRVAGGALDEELLEVEYPGVRADPGAEGFFGHGEDAGRHAEGAGDLVRGFGERPAAAQQVGAGDAGREVA